ncbi:MAG: ATP-binding cassette domain-containing protein [Actinomycetes bacterium]
MITLGTSDTLAGVADVASKVTVTITGGMTLNGTAETYDVLLTFGDRQILDGVTWDVGPGDRIGIIGVNGAGKTSLVRLLLGIQPPTAGRVVSGVTVKPAYLSQHLEELDPSWRVLEAVEDIAQRVELGKGRELSATQLCERLGFGGDAQWTPIGDLSGGERRRLQLTRLLMGAPNVLVLDEPTNDFDVETLTALEDLLDSFGGTLLVISHDRFFLERVCDRFVGLMGDGEVRDLPGGLEQYLQLIHLAQSGRKGAQTTSRQASSRPGSASADERAGKKELARLERVIAKLGAKEDDLHRQMSDNATDHVQVAELNDQLRRTSAEKSAAEEAWLELAVETA